MWHECAAVGSCAGRRCWQVGHELSVPAVTGILLSAVCWGLAEVAAALLAGGSGGDADFMPAGQLAEGAQMAPIQQLALKSTSAVIALVLQHMVSPASYKIASVISRLMELFLQIMVIFSSYTSNGMSLPFVRGENVVPTYKTGCASVIFAMSPCTQCLDGGLPLKRRCWAKMGPWLVLG